MLIEEMGELMQAISKHERKPSEITVNNIYEEIADVKIILEQDYSLDGYIKSNYERTSK